MSDTILRVHDFGLKLIGLMGITKPVVAMNLSFFPPMLLKVNIQYKNGSETREFEYSPEFAKNVLAVLGMTMPTTGLDISLDYNGPVHFTLSGIARNSLLDDVDWESVLR